MKPTLQPFFLAVLFVLNFGCQSKTVEELTEKDSMTFFSNIDYTDRLIAHPFVLPVNLPEELAEKNKAKSIERLQDYFSELCGDTKDFKLLNSYRKIGDNDQKILFLEYEFCTSGIVIMGYQVEENEVTLFSVWPMNKSEKPETLFTEEDSW